jgi:hypothetical protein
VADGFYESDLYPEHQAALSKTPPRSSESLSELLALAFHLDDLKSLLVNRGGFTAQEAFVLLYYHPGGDRIEIERRVSICCSKNFKNCRREGTHPGRRRCAEAGFYHRWISAISL